MINHNLDALNFEKYNQLLAKLLPLAAGLVVFDPKGAPVWHSSALAQDTVGQIQTQLRQQGSVGNNQAKTDIDHQDQQQFEVHHRVLRNDTDLVFGLLAVVVQKHNQAASVPIQSTSVELILETLAILAQLLQDEFQLNTELNSMAQELGDRYEELNLVYGAGDQVSNYAESQQAMQKLVEHVVGHLNVELAAILLSEQNKTYLAHNNQPTIDDVKYLYDAFRNQLLPWAKAKNKTLVINDLGDHARKQACPGIFYKMICYPVLDAQNQVAGILVCINPHDKVDFSNSDRNLMEMIGRKASKIMLATYDKLTGLLNRSSFEYIITQKATSDTYTSSTQTLLVLNINLLHMINDVQGLQAGDDLIKRIAKLLQGDIREGDIIGRIDGDQFGIVLDHCPVQNARQIAGEILSTAKQLPHQEACPISLSIGLAAIEPGKNADEVIMNAELALEVATEKGGGAIEVFDATNLETRSRQHHMRWVYRIQEALREDRFQLYCQGIYPSSINNAVPHHYEILLRLRDQDGSLVSPNDFIPAAEQYKLMPIIDRWVLKSLLSTLEEHWSELSALPISWAINLSGQTLSDEEFEKFATESLTASKVPAHRIGFEITETAAIERLAAAKSLITAVKQLGCTFYLDDFGSGLSSFAYLKNLNLDYIKIDGVFVKEILNDPLCEATVVAITHVAKVLGIGTIGEYVESIAIRDKLAELAVDYGQGYALHKPMPLEQVIANFSERNQKLTSHAK